MFGSFEHHAKTKDRFQYEENKKKSLYGLGLPKDFGLYSPKYTYWTAATLHG